MLFVITFGTLSFAAADWRRVLDADLLLLPVDLSVGRRRHARLCNRYDSIAR